jgi:hypothetical protein
MKSRLTISSPRNVFRQVGMQRRQSGLVTIATFAAVISRHGDQIGALVGFLA